MTNLIVHIGPSKCGSSSIQRFFESHAQPCVQKTRFIKVPPQNIYELNRERPDDAAVAAITELLVDNLAGCNVLILSHEYMFDCPLTIERICNIANKYVPKVTIIGYSRRQSDFMISAYSQWLFRLPDRVKEASQEVIDLGLDPLLFTGLERQLIASIANDFHSARQPNAPYSILNWHESYLAISQQVQETGAILKCGILPDKEASDSLIPDFCNKGNLTINKGMEAAIRQTANVSFNHDLIEAINIAVALGFKMPGPHERNEDIRFISNKMSPRKNTISEFMSNLKTYIDSYYLQSNLQLCDEYHLNKEYFYPASQLSKAQIIDIINKEGHRRSLEKPAAINKLQMLSALLVKAHLDMTDGS